MIFLKSHKKYYYDGSYEDAHGLNRDRAEIWIYKKNDEDDVDGMVDSARVA